MVGLRVSVTSAYLFLAVIALAAYTGVSQFLQPQGTVKSCIEAAKIGTKECILDDGWYQVTSPIDVPEGMTIRARNPGKVTITGTKPFTNTFKACTDPRCGTNAKVLETDLSTVGDIYQLFIEDVKGEIDMLIPARWPPTKDSSFHADHVADAPTFGKLYDTGKTWSMVSYGDHGNRKKRCKTKSGQPSTAPGRCTEIGHGFLVDDGKFDKQTMDAYEPGATPEPRYSEAPGVWLSESGIDITDAVAVIAFGKGPSEIARVKSWNCEHDQHEDGKGSRSKNCWTFEVDCSGSGDTSGKGGTYGTCGKRPLWKDPPQSASKCGNVCGKEAGFLHYHLREKLEFLDEEGEWYYDKSIKKLFLIPPKPMSAAPFENKKVKLHGRVNDYAFMLEGGSKKVVIEGIKFVASMVGAKPGSKHDSLTLSSNEFLYQNAVRAPLTDKNALPEIFTPNMYFEGDDMMFFNNKFKFAEGQAIEWKGEGVSFENNFVAWNGYSGTDAPFTIKLASGGCNTVTKNTLWYNGHVSGFGWSAKTCTRNSQTIKSVASFNEVVGMNWGHLQNDGAAFHCPIPGQSSRFERNWVSEGVHSMGIRFDTAGTTTRDGVGKSGEIIENVIKGDLVVKGEDHLIKKNIVTGKMMAIRQFGLQYDMLMNARFEDNLVTKFVPRGKKCNKWRTSSGNLPAESEWVDKKGNSLTGMLRGTDKLNVNEGQVQALKKLGVDLGSDPCEVDGSAYDLESTWLTTTKTDPDLCASKLVDCEHMDFRPLSQQQTPANAEAGAYAFADLDSQQYWIAGQVSGVPQRPVPQDQSECATKYMNRWGKVEACRPVKLASDPAGKVKTQGVSVSFVLAHRKIEASNYKECGRHIISYKVNDVPASNSITLRGKRNVGFIGGLSVGDKVKWQVEPDSCGMGKSPEWYFEVLDPSITTTTTTEPTTTTTEPCNTVLMTGSYPGAAGKPMNNCKLQMKRLYNLLKKGKNTIFDGADFSGIASVVTVQVQNGQASDATLQEALFAAKSSLTGGTDCIKVC